MKWKSADCPGNGILEDQGNLFVRLKCISRCERFADSPCSVEKTLNAAALTPADGEDDLTICCFNEKLFDYGNLKNFSGLCAEYGLVQTEISGKSYYTTNAENWLRLSKKDRKRMLAVFSRIDGDINYQRWLIFGGQKRACWVELIGADPDFYLDYRQMKKVYPQLQLSREDWLTVCLTHPSLYQRVVSSGECEFEDLQLAELLAKYPDLDDRAYAQLKQKATSEVWMRLLLGGVSGGHEKFWNDCDYSCLSGPQWIALLDAGEPIRREALRRLNDDTCAYSRCFTDDNWKTIGRKAYRKEIGCRPGLKRFSIFFGFAPRHAAFFQFLCMVGVSLFVTLLGGFGMAMLGGLSRGKTLACLLGCAAWSILTSWLVSWIAVRRERRALLHGAFVGAAGGVILPLIALLWMSEDHLGFKWYLVLLGAFMLGFAVLFFLTAFLSRVLPLKADRKERVDLSWGFYAILLVMSALCLLSCLNASNENLYKSCGSLGMSYWRKVFLNAFLKNENYGERWKSACSNGDADELKELIASWRPEPQGEGYEAMIVQLMDAVLEERVRGEKNCGIDELAKRHQLVGGEAKQHIRRCIDDAVAKKVELKNIVAYLKVFHEYGMEMDEELRGRLCGLVDDPKNTLPTMKALWDQMDAPDRGRLGERIVKKVAENEFRQVESAEDARVLLDIANSIARNGGNRAIADKAFWEDLLNSLVERKVDFHPAVCAWIKQMPGCQEIVARSEEKYWQEVTRLEIEQFERIVQADDLAELRRFLLGSKYLNAQGGGYQNDYDFWNGYVKREAKEDPFADWKKCFDAFLDTDGFKLEKTRSAACDMRSTFADMLGRREEKWEKALQLWKKNLAEGRDREAAYRGILEREENPAEFKKYFLMAFRDEGLRGSLEAPLRKNAAKFAGLNDLSPDDIAVLLELFKENRHDIPMALAEKVEKIADGRLTAQERLVIADYYLSAGKYLRSRELFDSVPLEDVKNRLDGESLYKLALIDPDFVEGLKSRLDSDDPKLADVKESFQNLLKKKTSGKYNGVYRDSFAYVRAACEKHYPEAIFIRGVKKFYDTLSGGADPDPFEQDIRDVREHHPDSEYIRYLQKL